MRPETLARLRALYHEHVAAHAPGKIRFRMSLPEHLNAVKNCRKMGGVTERQMAEALGVSLKYILALVAALKEEERGG